MNNLLIFIISILLIIIVTYFKASNENRTIIVYEDWNDVGLSFFSIIFPIFITAFFLNIDFLSKYAFFIGFILLVTLLGKLAIHTYKANNGNILYFIMAFITKIFLGITLFTQLLNVISPQEDENGNSNFWSAILILLVVVPIVKNLVVNKNQGSKVNPFMWISSRKKIKRIV
ncbi:hypothetical protein AAW30_01864 [Arcobacter porcinus]|uniref:hypothetical protein n=1 Tax=Arcobacter porcinus TaxID=1935204 RepID=UPI000824F3B2|nr:hypothetical protein [Arcobacter porcinus]OCL81565.1 hypothetical protein AAW30_01864 [Arcobacter porcinus]